jgi:hypothetical protein
MRSLAMTLLTAGTTVVALLAPSMAGAQTTLPPELQRLEAQGQQLHIESERFSMQFALKPPTGKETVINATGVGRSSPPVASEINETVGSQRVVVRQIGHALYLRIQGIAGHDGGRPWVRVSENEVSEQSGVDFAAAPHDLSASFGLINSSAEDIQQVASTTVDGQSTTVFSATMDLEKFFSTFGVTLVHKLQSVGVKTATLELFIAANGLPVRTSVIIGVEGGTIAVTTDVLQINAPVSVHAPAPRTTISEAQLRKLSKRR